MVKVYAVVLVAGVVALIAWILTHVRSSGSESELFDPEATFGIPGRRVVAGLIGFSMAGLSAEFSPRDLSWPVALSLAVVGAGAMAWYAGRSIFEAEPEKGSHTTEVQD